MENKIVNHPVLGLCEELSDDEPTKDGDLFVFPNGTIIQVKTDKSINPVMYGITNCFDGLGNDNGK